MPARLRHRIDTLQVTAVARPGGRPTAQVDSGVLMALSAAVHAREVLRFDYTPASSAQAHDSPAGAPPRRVQPHHVVTWGGRWYLVAWDLDRDGWRTFRADRITPRTPTGPRFTPRELPGGDLAAFVVNEFQGSVGWPCQGAAILDLPAEIVSRYAREGLVEAVGPDRCQLVLGSWSWPGLAAAFGRFDVRHRGDRPGRTQSRLRPPRPTATARRRRTDRRRGGDHRRCRRQGRPIRSDITRIWWSKYSSRASIKPSSWPKSSKLMAPKQWTQPMEPRYSHATGSPAK